MTGVQTCALPIWRRLRQRPRRPRRRRRPIRRRPIRRRPRGRQPRGRQPRSTCWSQIGSNRSKSFGRRCSPPTSQLRHAPGGSESRSPRQRRSRSPCLRRSPRQRLCRQHALRCPGRRRPSRCQSRRPTGVSAPLGALRPRLSRRHCRRQGRRQGRLCAAQPWRGDLRASAAAKHQRARRRWTRSPWSSQIWITREAARRRLRRDLRAIKLGALP